MLVLVSTSKCAWQYTVKANLQDFIEKNANFTEKVEKYTEISVQTKKMGI